VTLECISILPGSQHVFQNGYKNAASFETFGPEKSF